MEISAEKSKTMVTSRTTTNAATEEGPDIKIKVGEVELEAVKTFIYLGSTINEEITSENEIKKRLAIATNQLAKLHRIWNSSGISITVKIRPIKSLITSIVPYGCETRTYNKALEKRIASFELRCFRRILGITWKQRITNVEVQRRIKNEIGEHEPLLETARRIVLEFLQWFGRTSRRVGTLVYDRMHGSVNGSRGRGRPRRTWFDDIKDWSGRSIVDCLRASKDREYCRHIVNSSKCPNGRHA